MIIALGQAIAVARGTPLAAGEIELCTTSGAITVAVDAQGAPIRTRYCPDDAMGLLACIAPPEANAAARTATSRAHPMDQPSQLASLRAERPRARGPPFFSIPA